MWLAGTNPLSRLSCVSSVNLVSVKRNIEIQSKPRPLYSSVEEVVHKSISRKQSFCIA